MIRREPVVVTVSTGGSPALAAKIRDAIEKSIDPCWIAMAQAMQTLRPKIRSISSLAPSRRKEIFRRLASDQAIETLNATGMDGLLRWLRESFEELKQIR
jgi:siroheme synthase (precorrin-2 oxidase/ferrochelatase)